MNLISNINIIIIMYLIIDVISLFLFNIELSSSSSLKEQTSMITSSRVADGNGNLSSLNINNDHFCIFHSSYHNEKHTILSEIHTYMPICLIM